MQGLWKEKVGGYNHKGTYRKSQKRKHIIKDKGRIYLKKFDKWTDNYSDFHFHYNKELEIVDIENTTSVEKYTHATVYNALIKYPFETIKYFRDGTYWYRTVHRTVNCLIYKFERNNFYIKPTIIPQSQYLIYEDFGKDLPVTAWLTNGFEILQITETNIVKDLSTIKYNKHYFRKSRRTKPYKRFSSYNEKMFIYNKLVSWKADLKRLYNDGKRRKIGQKIAHGRDRTYVRGWISKKNWDGEIKTHDLSKSISWFVN